MRKPLFLAAFAAACLAGTAVSAQTLRIALASEPTAVDPHYHDLTPNNALAQHIFDSLVRQDEQRSVLLELDDSIQALRQQVPDSPELIRLTGIYYNLLRQWTQT